VTDTSPCGRPVNALHGREGWRRHDEARAALGISAASYTDPGLNVGTTVKAVHIQELRDRVREALSGASAQVPADGNAALSFDATTNRINTSGWSYDAAGNQTRNQSGGGWQRFQYDAANRLVKVKADDNVTVLASYTYADDNQRLITDESGLRTYYAAEGGSVIAEYTESGGSTTPAWSKSYVYLGARLLSTLQPNGSGGETIQYHHPDRLGTRLVTGTDGSGNPTSFEQVALPFGTALINESSGATNRRFTSYDRSATTGLDYAVNRHYDSQQGRFTQVDPAGMKATSLVNPQTLNLYAYCANDPVNQTDPSGLGFFSFVGKILKGIAKLLSNKWVLLVVGVAVGIGAAFAFYWAATSYMTGFFVKAGIILAGTSAALITAAFHPIVQRTFQIAGAALSEFQSIQGLIGLLRGPKPDDLWRWINDLQQDNKYDVNKILRDAREQQKATEEAIRLNALAWHEYEKCVSMNPIAIEYKRALDVATLKASIPLPGPIAISRVSIRTVTGAASLFSDVNIFTLAFGGMLHVLLANPAAETKELRDKVRPVEEKCMKSIKEKYGSTPVHPYWFVKR